MPTRSQLQKIYRTLFPGYRLRIVRKRIVRRPRGKVATAKYEKYKEIARALVHRKLEEFNRHYGLTYHRVAIRDQHSRWGSCSKKGNLNFNYRLALLPERLVDAVIVHELCHLKEFNHSPRFWALMSETIPDHKLRKQELNKLSLKNISEKYVIQKFANDLKCATREKE